MILKLLSIIKKNFLIILNSKLSSLILIFGPIFLILILGAGLGNTGIKNINTNVFIQEESAFTDNFLESLRYRSFIVYERDLLEECISEIRESDKLICIEIKKSDVEIPAGLGLTPEEIEGSGIGYSINLHVDFSRQRIAWEIINQVQGTVDDFSREISAGAGIKLNQKIDEYSIEVGKQRLEVKAIIRSLDEIDSSLTNTYNRLPTDQDQKEIDNILKDIETTLGLLRLNPEIEVPAETQTQFNYLKSNWGAISKDIDEVRSELNSIQFKLSQIKSDLIRLDSELADLERDLNEFSEMNFDSISQPIPLTYESATGNLQGEIQDKFEFLDYIFPSFLSFFILLSSLILSTSLTIRERTSNAYIRNTLSKTASVTFLLGTLLTVLLIVILQCTIILAIAPFFTNISIIPFLGSLFIILLIAVSLFSMIGILIGHIFDSQETSIIASISLTLFLILFSPLLIPLETLPNILKTLLSFTPLILIEEIFRRILIFEAGLQINLSRILALLVLFCVLFMISLGVHYLKKYREIK